MSAQYFFGSILSFVAGIALGSITSWGYSFAILLSVIAITFFLLGNVSRRTQRRFLVSLILFGAAAGMMRVSVSLNSSDAHILDPFVGSTVNLRGVVITDPDVREEYTNIVIEVHDVSREATSYTIKTPTRVLARVPSYPILRYGDDIVATGKIVLPKNVASKEASGVFDYRAFLAKDGIHYQMFFPSVSLRARDQGNFIYKKLFEIKMLLVRTIAQAIPEPEASLGSSILIGAKQSLGPELLRQFRETGVAHIVVLSGYNIAIIASGIARVTQFLPLVFRVGAGVAAIVLFSMMVGGGSTVIRAALMVLVVIIARTTGREASALRALAFAGGLMVAGNPLILLHDVSFQLSFTATLSLVVLAPLLEKYFLFIRHRMLREIIVATIAAQIFVLPLLVYHMGSISLVGIVSNVFIVPVVPLVMLSVFLVALFVWVPLVGTIFSFVAYALLAYILGAVSFFSQVPFASLSGITFPLWAAIVSYTILGFFIVKNSEILRRANIALE